MTTNIMTVLFATAWAPAWASLAAWGSGLAGARMARRRLIRASQWAVSGGGCLIAFAVAAFPRAALAASVNLAIGLVLLGRVAARKVHAS